MERHTDKADKDIKRRLTSIEKHLPKIKPLDLDKPLIFKEVSIKRSILKKLIQVLICLALAFVLCPPFSWPIQGNISSNFLFRFKPDSMLLNIEIHHGIDIAAPKGKPVFPTAIGRISEEGKSSELGNYVKINHLLGFESVYAHLDKITVKRGAIVVPGLTRIGKVGATGRATGPHLHFGIYIHEIALPPRTLLVFHTIRLKILGI